MEAIIYTRSKSIDGLKVKIHSEDEIGILYITDDKRKVFIPYSNIDRIEYV